MRTPLLLLALSMALGLAACSDSHSANPSSTASGSGRSAPLLYRQYCSQCHAGGSDHAPRVGLRFGADWQQRLQQRDRDALVQAAIHGRGNMPARGLCVDCSDAEIRDTVAFMLRVSGVE